MAATRAATWRLLPRALLRMVQSFPMLRLPLVASGIAFFGLLALFPALALIIAIWSLFADPAVVEAQFEMARGFLPPEAYRLIDDQMARLVSADSATLGWATLLSLGAAIWSSRAGVAALMEGLNIAYRTQSRNPVRAFMSAVGITILLIAVAVAALLAVVITPIFLSFLPLGPSETAILSAMRWLVAIALIFFAVSVVLRYGPNRRHLRPETPWLTPGLLLAVAVWAAISWLFSFYLSNFGRYNEVYGTLGAVIALLMWMWLSAMAVLAGALLNSEIEKLRAERRAAERHEAAPPDVERGL